VVSTWLENYDTQTNAWKADASVLEGLLTTAQKTEARHLYASKWFDQWGTHYISKVVMGGELVWSTTTDACTSAEKTKMFVDSKVCAGGTSGVTTVDGCAGFAQNQTDLNSKDLSSATCSLQVRGGDSSVCGSGECDSPCDLEAWKASLTVDNAAPISFELSDAMKFHAWVKTKPIGRVFYDIIGGWDAVGNSIEAEFKNKMNTQASAQGDNVALDKSACESDGSNPDGVASASTSTDLGFLLGTMLLMSWLTAF